MHDSRDSSYLDSVLDFPSVVSDDEGRLHDSGELDVAVSFMLTLELVQQGLIGSLRETAKTLISSGSHSKSLKTKVDTLVFRDFLSSDYFRKISYKHYHHLPHFSHTSAFLHFSSAHPIPLTPRD